ncbi:Uncharacterised protein [Vibrio cholerae]|nr:Uncharacterised protein [Vibrio cholerae]
MRLVQRHWKTLTVSGYQKRVKLSYVFLKPRNTAYTQRTLAYLYHLSMSATKRSA